MDSGKPASNACPYTILLVDDEHSILDAVGALLQRLGHHVVCAGGGRQAIEVFDREDIHIDLVILDLLMPEMDGRDTFEAIRRIRSDIPVLLSSGYNYGDQVADIMRQGCNGFIQKPYSITELHPLILKTLADAGVSAVGGQRSRPG